MMISSVVSAVVNAPWKKSAALNHMRAGFADDGNLGIAGHGDAGHFGGRIGMGNAAADRAAVADLIMRDVGDRGLEQRMRGREPLVVLDVAPAHHGAERDASHPKS